MEAAELPLEEEEEQARAESLRNAQQLFGESLPAPFRLTDFTKLKG